MKFFVPGAKDAADAERILIGSARFAKRPVPLPHERIFRLTFKHNGKVYEAEVGKAIDPYFMQEGWIMQQSRGTTAQPPDPTVMVIIGGNPVLVCLWDRGVKRGEPIYVGHPSVKKAEYFDD